MDWDSLSDKLLGACTRTFGVSVMYYPADQPAVEIRGVFDSQFTSVDPGTGAVVTSQRPNLGIQLSDLPVEPGKDDRVNVKGQTYKIIECRKDGQGGATLILQKA